jgi:hypothetical protein
LEVFTFSAATLTNIWAGVGSHSWAVSQEQAANPSIQGKARKFKVGSLGLFYCVGSKSITTPFIVSSPPRFDEFITHIWPEHWALPFGIVPLGSPDKQLQVGELAAKLPSLSNGQAWSSLFHISPITVFAPTQLTPEDWAILVGALVQP